MTERIPCVSPLRRQSYHVLAEEAPPNAEHSILICEVTQTECRNKRSQVAAIFRVIGSLCSVHRHISVGVGGSLTLLFLVEDVSSGTRYSWWSVRFASNGAVEIVHMCVVV